ncbi:unnamed protein product, partial [Allacma fusca]
MDNVGRNRGGLSGNNPTRSTLEYLLTGINKRPVMGYRNSIVKVKHGNKLLRRLKLQMSYADQRLYSSRQFAEGSNKYEEFFCYNADDEAEEPEAEGEEESNERKEIPHSSVFQNVSLNIADYVSQRHLGNLQVKQPSTLQPKIMEDSFNSESDFSVKHLLTNGILQEKPIKVENLNKVFCSQWLSDKQVILGTKCNKLIVLDVNSKHMTHIPSLNSSARSLPPDTQCGIHAIQINPSRTLLATGGKNPNDVAVYKLPTMDPVCVGEMAHQDWVFGISWIDEEHFVSGSRDTSLALWKVPDFAFLSPTNNNSLINTTKASVSSSLDHSYIRVPSHSFISAVSRKECKSAQKVRDVVFNRRLNELACVSLNGYIHIWNMDSERFSQKFSRKLPFCLENVCLAVHEDYGLYAVGSKSHTTLMDCRTIQCVKKIPSKYSGFGIRSANFYSTLLSIGTGQGTIMFYDLRAGKYLETHNNSARSATLKSSTGWTYPDEEIIMDVFRQRYTPAIYTHCIDMSVNALIL